MGGDDQPDNITVLTPEEHYLAHLLLVKINRGTEFEAKLTYAANMMGATRKGNKVYGWLKRYYSITTSGENNSRYGKARTDDERNRISQSRMGYKRSQASIDKQRATCAAKRALKPIKPKRIAKPPKVLINRKVDQYSLDGEYMQTFNNAKEASIELSIERTSITKCCTGKRATAGNYKWQHNRGR